MVREWNLEIGREFETFQMRAGEFVRGSDFMDEQQENKYAFQVGLADIDFDVAHERLAEIGLGLPFQNIDQAEKALRAQGIRPTLLLEEDGTLHQVKTFNPQPVGHSGFMNRITHSIIVTDFGLFDICRYPEINRTKMGFYWKWFLQKRILAKEQVDQRVQDKGIPEEQMVNEIYQHSLNG